MNRYWLIIPLLALFRLHAEERPNIIFILADDLGWADTRLYGHTRLYDTPNLDRLARRGMVFTRAYSASPLCSPTRASIMTGLSPARTGITAPNCHLPKVILKAEAGKSAAPGKKTVPPIPVTRLATSYFTLAEALKQAGYATGHFGKWHLGAEPYSPLQHGFDVDLPHTPGPGPAGRFVAPWSYPNGFLPKSPDEHIEDRMAAEASAFMERHKDGPFFINYWMFSVHSPFDAKKEWVERYRKEIDATDAQRSPTYAAMVKSMDDAVGTLLDTLDRLGLAENTAIIFFSDNGGNMYDRIDGTTPTSNRPLRGGKATVYEGGIRVPCVVSWPGIVAPSTRSDCIIQSSDFYPTILDLLDAKTQEGQHFDGVSIVPALKGETLDRAGIFTYFPHDPAVPDWLPPSVAVTSGDWKLIRLFHGGKDGAHRWKLYHLGDDPGEKNDLADREPERVKQMDAMIEDFLKDTGAILPVPNPNFDPAAWKPEDEGKAAPRKADGGADRIDPRLQGWRARNGKAVVNDGILRLTSPTGNPFLGFSFGDMPGPVTLRMRLRCEKGGTGRFESVGDLRNPPKPEAVEFTLPAGGWQEIEVELPLSRPLGVARIHLPASTGSIEIDWIQVGSADKVRLTSF
ncbi:MAG: sulfatase [Akkermansiaceae bacterium]|jgi:arylsulfatase A-like enzyme|nr:sulfatase [Akkermansiaceae bacterium]